MTVTLPGTGVPSAVENWSLAFSWGSDFPWEQGCFSHSKRCPKCCFTGILHPSRRQFLTACLFMDFLPHLSLQPLKQCLDASKIELVTVLKGCWIITLPNSSPMFCATKLIKTSPEQLKKSVWQYFKNLVKSVKYWNVKTIVNSQTDLSKAGGLFSSVRNALELCMCYIHCKSVILAFRCVYPNQCRIWDHIARKYQFHKRLERSASNYWFFFWFPITWTSQIIKQVRL